MINYWNYKGWVNIEPYNQQLWNETLSIKISKCSAKIYKKTKESADTIQVSNKMFELLKTLEYFHLKDESKTGEQLGTFLGRYFVYLNNEISYNKIIVSNKLLSETIIITNYESIEHPLVSVINKMQLANEQFIGSFHVQDNHKKIDVLYLNFLSDTMFSINDISNLINNNVNNVIVSYLPLGEYNGEVYALTEYNTYDEIKSHLSEGGKIIIYDSKVIHTREGLVINYRSKLI